MAAEPCALCGGAGEVSGRVDVESYPWFAAHPVWTAACPLCRHGERFAGFWASDGTVPWVGRLRRTGRPVIVYDEDGGDGLLYVDDVWGDMATGWHEERGEVEPMGVSDGR